MSARHLHRYAAVIKEAAGDWDVRVAVAIILGVGFWAFAYPMDWDYARIPIALLIGLFFSAVYLAFVASRDEARRRRDEDE